MIIVGGTYVERCEFPYWNQIYGSGLRAAVALSALSSNCALHTYVNELWLEDVEATLEAFGIKSNLLRTNERIVFDYLYGFDRLTRVDPETVEQSDAIKIEGDAVLRFGMLEGNACVKGRRVVFDPQYANAASFWDNGSEADSLALILNPEELIKSGLVNWPDDRDPRIATDEERNKAAQNIFDAARSRRVVLVVKHGVGGADIYTHDESPTRIPAYAADAFFKIGSGDVFAAAFAYAWAARQMHAVDAARYALLCSANYVECRQLPLSSPESMVARPEIGVRAISRIALSGSASEANAELLRHAAHAIGSLGGSADLQPIGLQDGLFDVGKADVVLGVFDLNANISDVEQLRSKIGDRRLIVFWPSPLLTFVDTPNTIASADYATALYLALREARR